ncbi:hypothetical protein B0H14DRAFT_2703594 [Mycena olivaceomarginata]|nr:hypothetical protein B0H14DRAFT_2703594 [Mycena olivaceomarginata]
MAAPGIRRPPHAPLAFQLLRDPAPPRVGRVCWYGAISGAERALRIVQAHMSASFTATSSSTSLRFPLLSFFPPPVLLDRFADAPLPVYPRSSSFLSALSLVLAPAAGNPPRKPQIGCINAGGRLSASARARPYSTSTALRARCTHSVGNGPHPYLTPVAPPRPRPSSLAPSAHTLLSPLPILYLHLRLQLYALPEPYLPTSYISAASPISDTSNESIVFFVRLSSCLNASRHRQRLQSIQFN